MKKIYLYIILNGLILIIGLILMVGLEWTGLQLLCLMCILLSRLLDEYITFLTEVEKNKLKKTLNVDSNTK